MGRSSNRLILLVCLAAVTIAIFVVLWLQLWFPRVIVEDSPRAIDANVRETLTELDASDAIVSLEVMTDDSETEINGVEDQEFPRPERAYTLMVYMVGTDLEANGGYATADLLEMIESGFDASEANVIVYTGGSQRWHANIPNNRNCIIEVRDGAAAVVASTSRSLNMGSPMTLAEFVAWTCENYPSEHTALVLWDHGSGPTLGCGFDQLYNYDSLTLPEMEEAMAQAGFGGGTRLDWVGFDACLMSSIEVAEAWRDYASYFVASQDLENGHGWNYAFLRMLIEDSDPRDVAAAVVDSFGAFFDASGIAYSSNSATLSAVDLSRLDEVDAAIDTVADALLADFAEDDFGTLAKARAKCRSFGGSEGSAAERALVDLGDLADCLLDAHPTEATALREAIATAVVSNYTSMGGANGLSLFFPPSKSTSTVEPVTSGYAGVLQAYWDQASVATEIEWHNPMVNILELFEEQSDMENQNSTVILYEGFTADQVKSLTSVSYSVLADYEGRGYVPIMQDITIEVDANGNLQLSNDPEVMVVTGDETTILPVMQTERRPERTLYSCATASLLPAPEYVETAGVTQAIVTLADEGGKVSVASSALVGNGQGMPNGRIGADLERYKSIMVSYGGWQYPERADDGSMLPWTEWDEQGGDLVWSEVPLSSELDFELRPVSELEGEFFLQVVITDIGGGRHASELIPLVSLERVPAVVPTEAGEFEFLLYEDHATLVGYRGSDASLTIPPAVDGLPVTEVGSGTLNNVWGISELVLPDSLKSIGNNALNLPELVTLRLGKGLVSIGCDSLCRSSLLTELELPGNLVFIGRGSLRNLGARAITLPSSLERIGEGALTSCSLLGSYEAEDGCKAVSVRDGVLYSFDGKCLVAFPSGRAGAFKVPVGTTRIGYGAFAGTNLSAISVPEGVTAIDNAAFFKGGYGECTGLASVSLPSSLESVGAYAFGSLYNGADFKSAPVIPELKLGPNLAYVGANAFGGLRLQSFFVDAGNLAFASPGGFLTNKMGDTILEAPSGMGQVVAVPEGVTTVGSGVFSLLDPGTDFVLPATLTRISLEAFPCHTERTSSGEDARVLDVRFHCGAGTAAAEFADRRGITWDTVCDLSRLVSKEVDVETGELTLSFRLWPDRAALHAIDATQATSGVELTIPDQVDGIDVLEIDGLQVSRGLPTTWQSVTLPSRLESLDPEAISVLSSREGFKLDEDNEHFVVRDGVLFSADEQTLVAYALLDPDPYDTDVLYTYQVPEGTRVIGVGAFMRSRLERVVLPASVRSLQRRAFAQTEALVDLQLNKGLERIEDYAISSSMTHVSLPDSISYVGDNALVLAGYEGFTLPQNLKYIGAHVLCSNDGLLDLGSDTLSIGRKLTTIGQGSLSSAGVLAFAVDEGNEHFFAIDGLLLTKNARRLLRCPAGRTGALRLPDGLLYLESGCLESCTGITDVYFPDSVIGVDAYATFGEGSPAAQVTFHCKGDSEAARYARSHNIKLVEEGA